MSTARILLVEDEAITSLDIQTELEKLGYQVLGAVFKGEDALKIAVSDLPDLVLMDINLRGKLDGIDTALQIRKISPIPVIFISAMVDDVTIERAKYCEPYGYIIKPIRRDDLRTTVEHALYRHETEIKLHQSESRFKELFETSLDGIVSTDLEGKILDCNLAFCRLVGYSKGELLGMSFAGLTPAEYIPHETHFIREQIKERGFSDEFEKEYIHQDGSRIPVSLRVWERKENRHHVAGYWGIVRNLTLSKEFQQTLYRQAEWSQKLVDLTASLNKHLDLPTLLEVICNELSQAMRVDGALITFADPKNEDVTIIHHSGPIQFDAIESPSLDLHRLFTTDERPFLYIYDIREYKDNPNHSFFIKYDIRSVLLIKLVCESRLIGTLDLASIGQWHEYSEDEIKFLLAYANQAALAIDRAIIYQETCNRAGELEIIHQLSSQLRVAENPQEMLPILLNGAMELTKSEVGVIYLLDSVGNPMYQFQSSPIADQIEEWFIPGGLLWARALSNQNIVHIPVPEIDSSGMNDSSINSLVLISLRTIQSLSAIMVLGFRHFTKMNLRSQHLLSSMAEIGGNALHRSGLMEMLEKRAVDRSSDLNTLYDFSVYINSPINFEEKLDGCLEKIIRSSGADCALIYRYDSSADYCLQLEAQQNIRLNLLSSIQELSLPLEIKDWLECSSIPLLVDQGSDQTYPLNIFGGNIFNTIINLPIRFENTVLGLLCILWKKKPVLSPDNIALLIAISHRVGSVIQNETLRKKSEHAALLEERNRLARELHDSVTQSLYSQTLLAEAAGDMIAQNDLSNLVGCLDELKKNSLQVLKEMRLLLFEMRPPLISEHGLTKALQLRLDAVERRAGVNVSIEIMGTIQLPAREQGELYFVALEALNNSLKHSGANSVVLKIFCTDRAFQMIIQDNGKGFILAEKQNTSMGLSSMRDRVEKIGGMLEINALPGKGVVVTVNISF